jgi:2-dehydropantoate 2-reductase
MLIIGTGAVATFLAESMSRAGLLFQVFGSESERLSVLNRRFAGQALSDPSHLSTHRLWFVCLKTWQNVDKIRLLKEAPRPEAILVLQNGLEPEVAWQNHFSAKVERGLSTYGVRSDSPGYVQGGAHGNIVLAAGSLFEASLKGCGFDLRFNADLSQATWHKLAVNASLNVVASIYDLPNGEILAHREARLECRRAAAEVRRVALAAGILWGHQSAWDITRSVAEKTAKNVCSTLADLRRGRPTEYDSINLPILGLARRHGVEVPTLNSLDHRFQSLLARQVRYGLAE